MTRSTDATDGRATCDYCEDEAQARFADDSDIGYEQVCVYHLTKRDVRRAIAIRPAGQVGWTV